MATKNSEGRIFCSICGKPYSNVAHADACRDSHDILYIPMTKTEFNRLLHVVMMTDRNLIPDSLVETFQRYQRQAITP